MSVENIVALLERARGYQECHPGLTVECAVGLTGLDLGDAERYAPLFEGCNLFAERPSEIPEEVYEDLRGRYAAMQSNLEVVRGHGLNPRDPEALSKAIDNLRSIPARH